MENKTDIYALCQKEETAYKQPIRINDNWRWNMYEHVVDTVTYKYGQLKNGTDKDNKPIKNVILPVLRLRYRTEGFDLKDIELFVDDKDEYWKSFLVKKYHEKWARDNQIDTFIDEGSEADIDFGGVLVKDVNDKKPEVVPWESLAFCDQTNLLSGTIGIKHNYAPDELMEMADAGWGKFGTTLEEVIRLADFNKDNPQTRSDEKVKTPGKYIEVYEIHGMFPKEWLKSDDPASTDASKFTRQVHIITFYEKSDGEKEGQTLFRGKLTESAFKFRADKIFGRALGYGGVEELTEAQVWTTYDQIRIKGLLDAAAKTVLKSNDPGVAARHPSGLKNLENLEIVQLDPSIPGAMLEQLNTQPTNLAVFENNIDKWEIYAMKTGGATEALMGDNPTSGTPFKLQDALIQQSLGIHEYRMGKYAVFIEEIYRDWIIPQIAKDLSKGHTFLAELDLDELQYVTEAMITGQVNNVIKEKILSGEMIDPAEIDAYKTQLQDEFKKKGNKHFVEILKGEFSKSKLNIRINIKGKQKDMVRMVDKLTNIFRFAFANPQGFIQTLQIPGMAKSFNELLEYSGMNPVDFTGIDKIAEQQNQAQQPQQQNAQAQPSPIQPSNVAQPQNA